MNKYTKYYNEKNASVAKAISLGLRGLKGVKNMFSAAKPAEKLYNFSTMLKTNLNPMSMGRTFKQSLKNPVGSFHHQMGLNTNKSREFLKSLYGTGDVGLQQFAKKELSSDGSTLSPKQLLQNMKDLYKNPFGEGSLEKAVQLGGMGLSTGGAALSAGYLGNTAKDVAAGKKGFFEGAGDFIGEGMYNLGGPASHSFLPGVFGSTVLQAGGKKIDNFLGFVPKQNNYANYYNMQPKYNNGY